MSSELRVPALKAQARRMVEDWEGPQIGSKPAMIAVLQDLLTAYDAQEARLAAVEAERDQYRQRANSAEARMGNYRADNRRLSEARVRVQQHNARLMALEQAAPNMLRAWIVEGEQDNPVTRAQIEDWVVAFRIALANLAAPSGDPS